MHKNNIIELERVLQEQRKRMKEYTCGIGGRREVFHDPIEGEDSRGKEEEEVNIYVTEKRSLEKGSPLLAPLLVWGFSFTISKGTRVYISLLLRHFSKS